MKKITIHEALGELKLLAKRIDKGIENVNFTGRKKKSATLVIGQNMSVQEFTDKVKGEYASITDLIKRRDEIKSKIVISNATTDITVGKETMKRAIAIERKKSIVNKKILLESLKRSFLTNKEYVRRENEQVAEKLDFQITQLVNGNKDSAKELENFSKTYLAQYETELIDPLNIEKVIEELEEEILNFESNIDIALSISNATTFIEIED